MYLYRLCLTYPYSQCSVQANYCCWWYRPEPYPQKYFCSAAYYCCCIFFVQVSYQIIKLCTLFIGVDRTMLAIMRVCHTRTPSIRQTICLSMGCCSVCCTMDCWVICYIFCSNHGHLSLLYALAAQEIVHQKLIHMLRNPQNGGNVKANGRPILQMACKSK